MEFSKKLKDLQEAKVPNPYKLKKGQKWVISHTVRINDSFSTENFSMLYAGMYFQIDKVSPAKDLVEFTWVNRETKKKDAANLSALNRLIEWGGLDPIRNKRGEEKANKLLKRSSKIEAEFRKDQEKEKEKLRARVKKNREMREKKNLEKKKKLAKKLQAEIEKFNRNVLLKKYLGIFSSDEIGEALRWEFRTYLKEK